jgi:hypothetical protein
VFAVGSCPGAAASGWAGAGCWRAGAVAAVQVSEAMTGGRAGLFHSSHCVMHLCACQAFRESPQFKTCSGHGDPVYRAHVHAQHVPGMILACKLDGCAAAVLPFVLLTRLRFGLSAEELRVLGSCLSPVVQEGLEVSVVQGSSAGVWLLIVQSILFELIVSVQNEMHFTRAPSPSPCKFTVAHAPLRVCQPGTC